MHIKLTGFLKFKYLKALIIVAILLIIISIGISLFIKRQITNILDLPELSQHISYSKIQIKGLFLQKKIHINNLQIKKINLLIPQINLSYSIAKPSLLSIDIKELRMLYAQNRNREFLYSINLITPISQSFNLNFLLNDAPYLEFKIPQNYQLHIKSEIIPNFKPKKFEITYSQTNPILKAQLQENNVLENISYMDYGVLITDKTNSDSVIYHRTKSNYLTFSYEESTEAQVKYSTNAAINIPILNTETDIALNSFISIARDDNKQVLTPDIAVEINNFTIKSSAINLHIIGDIISNTHDEFLASDLNIKLINYPKTLDFLQKTYEASILTALLTESQDLKELPDSFLYATNNIKDGFSNFLEKFNNNNHSQQNNLVIDLKRDPYSKLVINDNHDYNYLEKEIINFVLKIKEDLKELRIYNNTLSKYIFF